MRWRWIILLSCLFLLPVISLVAQNDACPALVEKALEEVGNVCSTLDRNTACYGFNRVDATFSGEVAENFFTTPSDRAELTTLQTIKTAPLSVDETRWGIALMSVQANVPNTLPGQAVVFMLLGDVEVQNQVSAETAFSPAEAITVKANANANIRSGPSTATNVVRSVPQGTDLPADGLSEDKAWLRVVFGGDVGWINRALVGPADGLDNLPLITIANQSPMQAFYFTTGIGRPQCGEPPAALVIQGPRRTTVNFTANGTDFSIGSTVILRKIDDNTIQIIVVDGHAEVGGFTIPGGFTMFAKLNDDGTIDEESLGGFRGLTEDEIEEFSKLEDFNLQTEGGEYLNYPIRFPDAQDIIVIEQVITGQGGGGNDGPTPSQIGGVDCSNLMPTSPIGGMPFGNTTFYWNDAFGADRYRVKIFGQDGSLARSVETNDATPNVNIDTGSFGGGPQFSWEVEAIKGEDVACVSGRVSAVQDPPPVFVEEEPKPKITASWGCGGSTFEVDVTWSGFEVSEPIFISFSTTAPPGTFSQGASGPSGTTTFFGVFGTTSALTVTGSTSGSVVKPGGFTC